MGQVSSAALTKPDKVILLVTKAGRADSTVCIRTRQIENQNRQVTFPRLGGSLLWENLEEKAESSSVAGPSQTQKTTFKNIVLDLGGRACWSPERSFQKLPVKDQPLCKGRQLAWRLCAAATGRKGSPGAPRALYLPLYSHTADYTPPCHGHPGLPGSQSCFGGLPLERNVHGVDTTYCFWNYAATSLRNESHPCWLKCSHGCGWASRPPAQMVSPRFRPW